VGEVVGRERAVCSLARGDIVLFRRVIFHIGDFFFFLAV
jgi:hypothetical protein